MEIIKKDSSLVFKTKLMLKNEYDPNLETFVVEEELLEQTNIMISELKKDLDVVFIKGLFEDIDVEFEDGDILVTTSLTERGVKYFMGGDVKSERLINNVKDLCDAQVLSFTLSFDKIILKMNREEHINSIADKYGKLHQIINESYMTIIQNDKDVMFKYPIKSNNKTIVGVDRGGKLITDNGYTNDHINASEIRNDFETLTIIADEILNKNK